MLEKTINVVACALIASLAFAQTSTTTEGKRQLLKPTPQPITAASETVTTTYEPGKLIVVGSEGAHDSVTYVLDKSLRYVNKSGTEIDDHLINAGTRIHLYFDDTGQTRVVNRVVVDERVIAFKAGLPFRFATLIPPAVFSLGAAGGHIYQMIAAHNFSPGNVGLVLPSDILIPVVGFVFLWLSYKYPKSEAGNRKLI
jgi:hypothetical protein